MKVYVVLKTEFDFDSALCERLNSVATFSTKQKAIDYIKNMLIDEEGDKETYRDDYYVVYDDDGIDVVDYTIIETEIDEFEVKSDGSQSG